MFELKKVFLFAFLSVMLYSCNLKYDSDILDLSFYQWNQWTDTEAENIGNWPGSLPEDISMITSNPPSCGWDELHRGNGNLVRIPAAVEGYSGVSWYHCRFTLPELWDKKHIVFNFDATGPQVEVYLNEALVGIHRGMSKPFEIDVTGKIYYTLDNHLAIRITDPESGGGLGNLSVKSSGQPEI